MESIHRSSLSMFFYIVISAVVGLSSSAPCANEGTISSSDAFLLARAALATSYNAKSPQLHPEEDKSLSDPHFYFFMGIWDNPSAVGSVTAGGFAIQRETGDVWDRVTCEEVRDKALTKLQKRIRRKINLTASAYASLRKKPPGCSSL